MQIEVTGATVIKRSHDTDIVTLETALPPAVYPYYGTVYLQFFCAKGDGVDYVATNFPGVPVRIVSAYHESKA